MDKGARDQAPYNWDTEASDCTELPADERDREEHDLLEQEVVEVRTVHSSGRRARDVDCTQLPFVPASGDDTLIVAADTAAEVSKFAVARW